MIARALPRILAPALLALAAMACTTTPGTAQTAAVPLAPGVIDARSEFERILCAINAARGSEFPDSRPCAEILARFDAPAPMPRLAHRDPCCYTLVFVSGILGECVAHIATPFSDSYARLRARGHQILEAPVKGRASSAQNARIISAYLAKRESKLGKVVLIGYSKGVSDVLEALALDPQAGWIRKVVAVVSVAGVVKGTPAADQFAGLYDAFFAKLPWPTCAPEDRGGLRSLTRSVRNDFLARNKLPDGIKYYSLVAAAHPPHINPLLLPFHEALLKFGPNDGQMVAQDAIIPGSYLLGFLNGDHWAVALPFNRSTSLEATLFRLGNAFPREVLIDAILEFVSATIDR